MNSKKHVLDRAICDLYSLEIDAEQVIPAYLDSRLHVTDISHQNISGKRDVPKRKAAIAGENKTSVIYNAGEA